MELQTVNWTLLFIIDAICILLIVTSLYSLIEHARRKKQIRNLKFDIVSWGLLLIVMVPITMNNYFSLVDKTETTFLSFGLQLVSASFMGVYLFFKKAKGLLI